MSAQRNPGGSDKSTELEQVSQETAGRLSALGIVLDGRELPEDLVRMEEAVEKFEHAVEARGGDLMMDEGVGSPASEPDDPHFALPVRNERETVAAYLERLARATDAVKHHKKH